MEEKEDGETQATLEKLPRLPAKATIAGMAMTLLAGGQLYMLQDVFYTRTEATVEISYIKENIKEERKERKALLLAIDGLSRRIDKTQSEIEKANEKLDDIKRESRQARRLDVDYKEGG